MGPYLTGKQTESPRTEIMLGTIASCKPPSVTACRNAPLQGALISGKFKIVMGLMTYGFWQGPVYPNATTNHTRDDTNEDCISGCLFNIIEDPGEHNNLAKQMPDKLQKMIARWKALNATSYNAVRHEGSAALCNAYVSKHRGFCGPLFENETFVEFV